MVWSVPCSGTGWNPWREMGKFQSDFRRVFRNASEWDAGNCPAINVWTNEDGAVVTAEIPGVNTDDLDITVSGGTLTLKGTGKIERSGGDVEYHRHERSHGDFARSLRLPFAIDAKKVEAQSSNGVLRLTLPRAEEDKPRKISVARNEKQAT